MFDDRTRGRRLSRNALENARSLARNLRHKGDRVVLAPMDGGADVHGVVTRCWHWMRTAIEVPGPDVLIPGQPSRLEVRLDDGAVVTMDVRDPSRRWYVADSAPDSATALVARRGLLRRLRAKVTFSRRRWRRSITARICADRWAEWGLRGAVSGDSAPDSATGGALSGEAAAYGWWEHVVALDPGALA